MGGTFFGGTLRYSCVKWSAVDDTLSESLSGPAEAEEVRPLPEWLVAYVVLLRLAAYLEVLVRMPEWIHQRETHQKAFPWHGQCTACDRPFKSYPISNPPNGQLPEGTRLGQNQTQSALSIIPDPSAFKVLIEHASPDPPLSLVFITLLPIVLMMGNAKHDVSFRLIVCHQLKVGINRLLNPATTIRGIVGWAVRSTGFLDNVGTAAEPKAWCTLVVRVVQLY